jgi:hypothetical protein
MKAGKPYTPVKNFTKNKIVYTKVLGMRSNSYVLLETEVGAAPIIISQETVRSKERFFAILSWRRTKMDEETKAYLDAKFAAIDERLRALEGKRKSEIKVGSRVILGRHELADPGSALSDHWNRHMDEYVGRAAYIKHIRDSPSAFGNVIARVDLDDGNYWWRLENMVLVCDS